MHAFDRQTDGQTDRIPIAIPRLHSMQRGKNSSLRMPIFCSFCVSMMLRYLTAAKSYNVYSRPYLDLKTASTIATSIIHSKLDYCNSLYYDLSEYQLNRLQFIKNSLARAVVTALKSSHITPSLRSLLWLKIKERIYCKICYFFLLVKSLLLPNRLISMILFLFNHIAALVTLMLSPLLVHHYIISLKVNNRSFRHASPRLWNELPKELRQPVDDASL